MLSTKNFRNPLTPAPSDFHLDVTVSGACPFPFPSHHESSVQDCATNLIVCDILLSEILRITFGDAVNMETPHFV